MKKQRKLLTMEEKERICQARHGRCTGDQQCPLFVALNPIIFCYQDMDELEELIDKMHNEEVEYIGKHCGDV